MKKPTFLIILDGPMGSGKSTVADLLHQELPDTVLLGVDRMKQYFTKLEKDTKSIYAISQDVIFSIASTYLEKGVNAIVDQVMRKGEVETYKKFAEDHDVSLYAYELDAPRDVLNERIKERTEKLGKPEISRDHIDENYKNHIESKYSQSIKIDTSTMSPDQVKTVILNNLVFIHLE